MINGVNTGELLKTFQTLDGIFGQNVDIHTYTRPIGESARILTLIEDQNNFQPLLALDVVISEIQQYTSNANARTILESIRQNQNNPDPETGLNAANMLCRVWRLAKRSPYSNAKDIVVANLSHNVEAGGGCLAGICARLVQPYAAFMRNDLDAVQTSEAFRVEEKITRIPCTSNAPNRSTTTVSPNTSIDDLELQAALELSRTMTQSSLAQVEDDQMELARALGLLDTHVPSSYIPRFDIYTTTRSGAHNQDEILAQQLSQEDEALQLAIALSKM